MADPKTEFFEHLVERLNATAGDTQAQAAVAAGFVITARPEPEREALRSALDAAAVLRWFDSRLIGKILMISDEEARRRFEKLKSLPFIERYRATGDEVFNVHESTRLGWRRLLAREHPALFARLSARAAAYFAGDQSPEASINRAYHLLCSDPERGADELEFLDRDWSAYASSQDRYALSAVLTELEDTRLVKGRASASAV